MQTRVMKTSLVLLSLYLLSACQVPPVPGVLQGGPSITGEDSSPTAKPVRLSTIIAGVKCEVATAMLKIKDNYTKIKDARIQNFVFYGGGTVTITVNTQVIEAGNANITIVVPFGAGHTISPIPAFSRTGTGTKELIIEFDIDPATDDKAICQTLPSLHLDPNNFISTALITLHSEFANIPRKGQEVVKWDRDVIEFVRNQKGEIIKDSDGKPKTIIKYKKGSIRRTIYGPEKFRNIPFSPKLQPRTLDLTAKFVIVWKGEIGTNVIVSVRGDITGLTPDLNLSSQRTDTHTVKLSLKLKPGQEESDPRRISECAHEYDGNKIMRTRCVERTPRKGELDPVNGDSS